MEFKAVLDRTIRRSLNIIYRNKVASPTATNGIMPAAYLPNLDDTAKQDTYLNEKGARAVADLCKELSDLEHPTGIRLVRMHGQSFIKSIVDELIPQINPDFNWAVETLSGFVKNDWNVFIAVENIIVKQMMDLGLCKIHPPKLPQLTTIPSEFQSQYDWLLDHHFIEVEISAPNLQAAHLKAREWAWTIFAFIHTPHVSMVTAKGPETLPIFFCYNRTKNQWFSPEWNVSHRMIEFNSTQKHDLIRIKYLKDRLQKWQVVLSSNNELSEVLQQVAVLIQMCKTNTDEGTKLLLLVGAMDGLLMDQFFPSKQGKEFNRRIGILIPQLKKWGFKSDLTFLSKVYKLRSEIVHNGERHLLNHYDLLTLEAVAVVLLNMLTDTGATNHSDALKSLNIMEPPKKTTRFQQFKTWFKKQVRSLASISSQLKRKSSE